jgi:hypothetical protein
MQKAAGAHDDYGFGRMNYERTLACGNGRSKEVLKAGLRGWPRLFQLGYEPDV